MSNALATITFKDGTKLYTQYQGSSDCFYSSLFATPEEAWSLNRHIPEEMNLLNRDQKMQEPEKVIAHSDYGGGSDFEGTACKKTNMLRVNYPDGWFGDFW